MGQSRYVRDHFAPMLARVDAARAAWYAASDAAQAFEKENPADHEGIVVAYSASKRALASYDAEAAELGRSFAALAAVIL
jgi:alkylation response protein AidB-like acyl-CoA dehydrogenase